MLVESLLAYGDGTRGVTVACFPLREGSRGGGGERGFEDFLL